MPPLSTSPSVHGARVERVSGPASAGARTRLDYDAGVLSPASEDEVARAVADLSADPALRVRIEVQVASRRPDAMALARLRAANLRDLLISRGASPDRVDTEASVTRGDDRVELVRVR